MSRTETVVGVVIAAGAAVWLYKRGPIAPDGGSADDTPQPEANNAGWSQYVYQNSINDGYHPELAGRTIQKYTNGQRLDGEEFAFLKSALNRNGGPTVMPPLPNNSPIKGLQTVTGPQPVNAYTTPEGFTG